MNSEAVAPVERHLLCREPDHADADHGSHLTASDNARTRPQSAGCLCRSGRPDGAACRGAGNAWNEGEGAWAPFERAEFFLGYDIRSRAAVEWKLVHDSKP